MIVDVSDEDKFNELRTAFARAMMQRNNTFEASVFLRHWEDVCEERVVDTEVLEFYGIVWS